MADCNAQTNVPTVDNTALACDEFIGGDCIIMPNGYPLLLISAGSTLSDFVDRLITKINNQNAEIVLLQNRLDAAGIP